MIQIKGINDYLLFIFNDEVYEDILLETLKAMISSPSFKKKGFYPKAYFDFGKRTIDHLMFSKLMAILEECQSIIFCGLTSKQDDKKALYYVNQTIRNGEVLELKEDCLFDGKINPGGLLVVYGNLYLIGSCYGSIELIGDQVTCSGSVMKHASIGINHYRLDDVSIDEMTVFYVDKEAVQMKQEEFIYG